MARKKQGTVRIIGGRWRGRRLPVPDLPGLRPSGDRGRETLFNWLAPVIRGARCADLFAGTGALGLEAASRGAESVVLVEKAPAAARALSEKAERLLADGGGAVQVLNADALAWLASCDAGSLDLVFIDPPFDTGLEVQVLELLAGNGALARGGLAYLEMSRQARFLPGADWETVKEKVLGDVQMRLLKKI